MCPLNIVLWCFVLLFVASSSESREHSTNGDEQSDNSTVQYEFLINSMKYRDDEMKPIQCNSRENFIKNDDEIQYEFHINSTKNDDSVRYESRGHIIKNREESNQMSMESRANSTENFNMSLTKTEDESNSTSYEFGNTNKYNNNSHNITVVSYEACDNVTCIQLCCPFGDRLTRQGQCVAGPNNYSFPNVYKYDNDSEDKTLDELFQLTIRDPCVVQGFGRNLLHPKAYLILPNGSLYQGPDKLILSASSYCLAIFNRDIYDVIACTSQTRLPIYVSACLLVSLPFLLLTFVVYSILPELQNMHGYTLRAQVASLFIAYVIMYMGQQISGLATKKYCIPLAYIFNFSFLSNFFWLNITCFDIWWTFRGLRSHQTSLNQEKKKFVIYSIYAWGIAFILTVACVIIDVSEITKNWIRPEICQKKFWFSEDLAKTIYFYIPIGATIISNICFFIATTVTILYQSRHIAHQLKDSESRRHNENKQRFNMYLKLFIVMGISWVMEVVAWSIDTDLVPSAVWYPTDMINALQGLIIFIIFVCRKKIKRLLLKRFGGQNCGPFCKIPMYNNSTASNTTSTSALGTVPMQERSDLSIVPQNSIDPTHSTAM